VLDINTARAEAVFVSTLQPSDRATGREIHQRITDVVRAWGSRKIAEAVAVEFGDHPDTAAARMRWAKETVAVHYPGRAVR
jgi:hypothetical protein